MKIKNLIDYFIRTKDELFQVKWASIKEVYHSSIAVIIILVVFSLIVLGFDSMSIGFLRLIMR